jgi:hypothetical protein
VYVGLRNIEEVEWEVDQLMTFHREISISLIKRTFPQEQNILDEFVADLSQAGVPE